MQEKDIIDFCNIELGNKTVNVEITNAEYRTLIEHAIDVVAPWADGTRFVQASGKTIDLSAHHPLGVRNIWNTQQSDTSTVLKQQFFGSEGLILWDANFLNSIVVYKSYQAMMKELEYQRGMNYELINNVLYLSGFSDSVVIELFVKAKVVSDIDESSKYAPWIKKYTLALAKELLARKRGKTVLNGSPIALDAQQLISEAIAEKTQLESEIDGSIFIL